MKPDQISVCRPVQENINDSRSPAVKSTLAVGYARVAAASQAQPRSGIDTQIAEIRSLAEANRIELVRVFEDLGESAHNMDRPGLLSLLAAIDAYSAKVVIVADLSRLARDARDLHRLLDSFDQHGVRVLSLAESLDTVTAAGRRHLGILCQLAYIFE